MTKGEISIDKNVYAELIESIKIKNICLNKLELGNVNHDINSKELYVNVDFNNDKYNIKESGLQIYPNFCVTVISDDEDKSKSEKAFELKIEFLIEYLLDDVSKYDREYINVFLTRNVPVNIWPYAREIISSLTTRMGFPALLIEPYTIKG